MADAAMTLRYSRSRAWYGLSILILLYCLSYVDRLILSLLAPAISEHLQISDTQLGVLFGLGFGVVYALTGLPLAHLIDRSKRVPLVAAGVALWSFCTVASGFAQDFTWLLILRAGVAIGEAVLSPAAISIIADVFPREKRTLPTTLYTAVATVMGSGSFVLGGAALQMATFLSERTGLEPWQLTLVFVGAPGLLLAPLFLFSVPEPPRTGEVKSEQFSTPREAFRYLASEKVLYGCMFTAVALLSMASHAKIAWTPTLLVRGHGMEAATVGYIYGTVGLVAGVIGASVWPTVVKTWTDRGRRDALINVFAVCLTLSWIFLAVVGLTRSTPVLLASAGISNFFSAAATVLIPLLIQLVTPGRMRARIMAIYLMSATLIGLALGPPVAAMISEHFFEGPFAIGLGMSALVLAVGPISSLAIWMIRTPYTRALDLAEAREAADRIAS